MRKPISELAEIYKRNQLPYGGFLSEQVAELQEVSEKLIKTIDDGMPLSSLEEMHTDFIIIRLVTILENALKRGVAELIDHGDPFLSLGTKIILDRWSKENVVDAIRAFHQKKITFGFFCSHGISVGKMETIINTLETILQVSLKEELSIITPIWVDSDGERSESPIIKDVNKIIESITKLLNVRHILVHELPRTKPYTFAEVSTFLDGTYQFLDGLEWISIKKRFGGEAKTQHGLNMLANEQWIKVRNEFNEIRGGDEQFFSQQQSPEAKLEYHWDQFCDLSAKVRAGFFSGPGSMAPMIYYEVMEKLTRWRIEETNKYNPEEGYF